MDEGIRRLQDSRRTCMRDDHCVGVEAGKKWALEYAEWSELDAVSNLPERGSLKDLQEVASDVDDEILSFFDVDRDERGLYRLQISKEKVVGFITGARCVRDQVEETPDIG